MKNKLILFIVIVILVLSAGCGGNNGGGDEAEEVTAVPTNTEVPPTDVPPPPPTDTPEPTADLAATAAAEEAAAMAAREAEIGDFLSDYNVSMSEGHVAWVQEDPVKISLFSFNEGGYKEIVGEEEFANFVLKVEITWDSQTGLAGCGVIFRAEKDLDVGKQYQFLTLRLSGAPAWDVEFWRYGQFQSTASGGVQYSNAIDLDSGATNEYVLVLRGTTGTIYANGQRMGGVNLAALSEGRVAFTGFQESGETTCTYENAWIFVLD